ncbi:hypothetical protein HN903_03775 [archaeon]|nr:hypothetical protein [archaeon]MBT7128849.1 hypothetical protein [archaeon]
MVRKSWEFGVRSWERRRGQMKIMQMSNASRGCWSLVVGRWFYSTRNHSTFGTALSCRNLVVEPKRWGR